MQRRVLIQHLQVHGCVLLRAGGEHSIYHNPAMNQQASVPRHREVSDITARKICRKLGIPDPP